MTKHRSRKDHWKRESLDRYSCDVGKVVHEKNGWYGLLDYRLMSDEPGDIPVWIAQQLRLGPFKRPRNAMVELEREVTLLKNRHEKKVLFGDQAWSEA